MSHERIHGAAFTITCQFCGSDVVWRNQQSGCSTERVALVQCANGKCRREQYVTVILRPLDARAS